MSKKEMQKILTTSNQKLAFLLSQKGIIHLRITSLGNSIASGYSMTRVTKPLLLRNETFVDDMKKFGIEVDRYHFARAQNNNDEHIYNWIVNNIHSSDIHKLNQNDYGHGLTSMLTYGMSNIEIEKYFPMDLEEDKGLQDIILAPKKDLANIVIYNGCTGSFLDAITRKGKISQQLLYGVNRDITSLEATLKFIQASNRKNNTNTQVYLCGAPNMLGLNISEIINHKLKEVSKKYANVIYVEPVKSKFFYQRLDSNTGKNTSIVKQLLSYAPDVHYDEVEYLELNQHIIKSITEYYSIIQGMIEVDRKLLKVSRYLELENQNLLNNQDLIQKYIRKIIKTTYFRINEPESRKKFMFMIYQYLNERYPFDFYYLGKDNIHNVLKKTRKK